MSLFRTDKDFGTVLQKELTRSLVMLVVQATKALDPVVQKVDDAILDQVMLSQKNKPTIQHTNNKWTSKIILLNDDDDDDNNNNNNNNKELLTQNGKGKSASVLKLDSRTLRSFCQFRRKNTNSVHHHEKPIIGKYFK